VMESLVKAGAFDSLGFTRAHLLAHLDGALEAGQRQQRERAEGQASFFDFLPSPEPGPATASLAIVDEWDDDQRLAYEKEVLGFYVSGHPLARYRSLVDSLDVTATADLGAKSHGARVRLLGHAVGVKETATKSGNRMAFFTLEDMHGTVEVTVFPEPYKAAAPALGSGEPLLVRGRVDDGDKGRVILAEEIRLLDATLARVGNGQASEPQACRIRVPVAGDDARGPSLTALRSVCAEHPGSVPLFVHVMLPAREVVVRARGLSVDASPELVARVETILGPGTVVVERAGRA
jgi:DNA polymerase III subunit alpha